MSESLEQKCCQKLNDKIVSLPDILCAICKKILCSPIVLVANIGNVCGLCRKKIDSSDPFIINSALENVIKQLAFPCMYQKNGCNEKTSYWNLQAHQMKCKYRSYVCPMVFFNDCDWHGHSSILVEHMEECHPNSVRKQAVNNSISIDMDISKPSNYGLLLVLNQEPFFLHIKCDLILNKLWYVMYYLGDSEKATLFHYNVEQKGNNNSSIKFESNVTVTPGNEFTNDFDTQSSLSFDLSFLKQILRESSYFISVITIVSPTLKCEEIDEKFLNIFECPVCNNFMKPPIFQCYSGHSVCNQCRPKLQVCPTCRSSFGNTRNYSLEALSSGVRFPCGNRELGCSVVMASADIVAHEAQCPYRPYSCPLKDTISCLWESNQSKIITHLKACHSNKVQFTNTHKIEISLLCNQVQNKTYMACFDVVFRVWFRYDNGNYCYWAVHLMESKGLAKNYKYKIWMVSPRNENHSLTLTDLCQEDTGSVNSAQFHGVPISVVNNFCMNGEFQFWCKISEINK